MVAFTGFVVACACLLVAVSADLTAVHNHLPHAVFASLDPSTPWFVYRQIPAEESDQEEYEHVPHAVELNLHDKEASCYVHMEIQSGESVSVEPSGSGSGFVVKGDQGSQGTARCDQMLPPGARAKTPEEMFKIQRLRRLQSLPLTTQLRLQYMQAHRKALI